MNLSAWRGFAVPWPVPATQDYLVMVASEDKFTSDDT